MRIHLESLTVAVLFGFLFTWLRVPIPWMLGPIAGLVIWSTLIKKPVAASRSMRNSGLIVLGYLIGSSFTIEAGREIIRQLPWMTLSTVLMVLISLFMGWVLARWMKISLSTAIIGTIPGGLSQVAVLAEEVKDADPGTVIVMQTIRVLTVIFLVPFLAFHTFSNGQVSTAGILEDTAESAPIGQITLIVAAVLISPWLAGKLRVPTPYFLGPVLAAIGFVFLDWHPPHLPELWINLAQIAVGAHLGTSIQLNHLSNWRSLVPRSLANSLLTVAVSLLISAILVYSQPISYLTAFLSTAPGGMAEMSVTAAMTGGDIAVVSAYQLFRILFILVLVPPIVKWLLNRRAKKEGLSSSPPNKKLDIS
ncbi:AbrB family transcriptional regulator [Paenibacillus senegalensis]|uniref:AbrB family transcriptional regulator n=1 Tax=Paenibacillus senegalensis TaxID=1465766 RepID=UPI0002895407|nr:AbrB family transcriptional regulator [Paenibacillus senegalensis]